MPMGNHIRVWKEGKELEEKVGRLLGLAMTSPTVDWSELKGEIDFRKDRRLLSYFFYSLHSSGRSLYISHYFRHIPYVGFEEPAGAPPRTHTYFINPGSIERHLKAIKQRDEASEEYVRAHLYIQKNIYKFMVKEWEWLAEPFGGAEWFRGLYLSLMLLSPRSTLFSLGVGKPNIFSRGYLHPFLLGGFPEDEVEMEVIKAVLSNNKEDREVVAVLNALLWNKVPFDFLSDIVRRLPLKGEKVNIEELNKRVSRISEALEKDFERLDEWVSKGDTYYLGAVVLKYASLLLGSVSGLKVALDLVVGGGVDPLTLAFLAGAAGGGGFSLALASYLKKAEPPLMAKREELLEVGKQRLAVIKSLLH